MDKENEVFILKGISPSHKKKEILPLVTDKMDESRGLYAKGKLSQTEKDKTIRYMWNLKKKTATKQN